MPDLEMVVMTDGGDLIDKELARAAGIAWFLKCPTCGGENLHMGKVKHASIDGMVGVAIGMWCEVCHHWGEGEDQEMHQFWVVDHEGSVLTRWQANPGIDLDEFME